MTVVVVVMVVSPYVCTQTPIPDGGGEGKVLIIDTEGNVCHRVRRDTTPCRGFSSRLCRWRKRVCEGARASQTTRERTTILLCSARCGDLSQAKLHCLGRRIPRPLISPFV